MLDKSGILLKKPCLAMVRSGTAVCLSVCLSVLRSDPSSNRVCGKPNSRGEQATSKVYYKFILESLQMKKDLAKVNRRLCRQTSFGDKDCVCSNRLSSILAMEQIHVRKRCGFDRDQKQAFPIVTYEHQMF